MVFAAVLCGCAPGPLTYPRYADDAAVSAPAPPGYAKVVVFRAAPEPHPCSYPSAASRRVEADLDGVALPGIDIGEYLVRVLPAGTHALGVRLSGWPGACIVAFDLGAASTAFDQVLPRESYWNATLGAQVIWGATSAIPLVNVFGAVAALAVGTATTAAESAGKACGGPFSIAPVEAATALPMLPDLHLAH